MKSSYLLSAVITRPWVDCWNEWQGGPLCWSLVFVVLRVLTCHLKFPWILDNHCLMILYVSFQLSPKDYTDQFMLTLQRELSYEVDAWTSQKYQYSTITKQASPSLKWGVNPLKPSICCGQESQMLRLFYLVKTPYLLACFFSSLLQVSALF